MSEGKLIGGCLCGSVRYETSVHPTLETFCHCTTCRRASGAPLVAWFTVPDADFRFTAGEPTRYRSSAAAERAFCSSCGTQLTFKSDENPGEIDITTCSLDEPERAQPRDHTWVRSQLSWVRLADGLPQHAKQRA